VTNEAVSTGEVVSRFNRILLPLDGSKHGEAALSYVEGLAIATKAEIILLQVVTPPHDIVLAEGYTSHLSRISEEYIEHASAAAKDYLDAVKERLMKLKIAVRCEVETGSPAERIIGYAKENNIDLIAISTHGRSGISRWLLGSVADKVLHATDRPVLLVRAMEERS
jgi:nucleotide-binding universal stress UspA family protein